MPYFDVEFTDYGDHPRRHTETTKYLTQQILIDRVIGLLDDDEAEEEWHPCLPP